MENKRLKNEMISRFKPVIASWDVADIYVISLWVNDYCDNPCEPTVTLGYNTEAQYNSALERASSKEEARWNFAFWLHSRELVFGENETREIVKDWIVGNDMPYFPCVDYDFSIPDEVDKKILSEITNEFVSTLVDVVKELHETGFIQNKFGKAIPLIIHELEYYKKIARQNERANPACTIKDFVQWVEQPYQK